MYVNGEVMGEEILFGRTKLLFLRRDAEASGVRGRVRGWVREGLSRETKCVCVCVCMCVRERERETERQRWTQRLRGLWVKEEGLAERVRVWEENAMC